jgi:hypothetical protein
MINAFPVIFSLPVKIVPLMKAVCIINFFLSFQITNKKNKRRIICIKSQ